MMCRHRFKIPQFASRNKSVLDNVGGNFVAKEIGKKTLSCFFFFFTSNILAKQYLPSVKSLNELP